MKVYFHRINLKTAKADLKTSKTLKRQKGLCDDITIVDVDNLGQLVVAERVTPMI